MNWLGIPAVALYALCMLIWPWFEGHGSWKHVHSVWETWQTFNAALIAFVASLLALNISRVKDDKQREREFQSAKALLPAAFSELSAYFKDSATFLGIAWNSGTTSVGYPVPLTSYRTAFQACIRHASPQVGEYLASILVKLQVHEARMLDMTRDSHSISRENLISYMYALGKIKVLVDKQFAFARGERSFDATPAQWEDYRNAYGLLRLHHETYTINEELSLAAFTQRAIARQNKSME